MTLNYKCKQADIFGTLCRADVRLNVRVGSPVPDPKVRSDIPGGDGKYDARRKNKAGTVYKHRN